MKRVCTEIRLLMEDKNSLFTRAANEMHMGIGVPLQKRGHAGKISKLTASTQQNCCLPLVYCRRIFC